jgi:hypothetical protein
MILFILAVYCLAVVHSATEACDHSFCQGCFTKLEQNGFHRCPLCRKNLDVKKWAATTREILIGLAVSAVLLTVSALFFLAAFLGVRLGIIQLILFAGILFFVLFAVGCVVGFHFTSILIEEGINRRGNQVEMFTQAEEEAETDGGEVEMGV